MIVLAIVALSGVVIAALVAALGGLPSYPSEVVDAANLFLTYVRQGVGFVYAWTYAPVVKAMLAFMVAVIAVYEGYKLVMWVVKKIPMFGVSD